MKNSVSITFFLRANRLNQNGEAPVYVRVIINSQRIQSSTGIFVEPAKWIPGKARLKGNSEAVRTINTAIENKQTSINKFINKLEAEGKEISADALNGFLKGTTEQQRTLLEVFDYHNKMVENLLNRNYALKTYQKYLQSRKKLASFIQFQFKRKDILLSELNHAFIASFDFYLRTECDLNNNTVMKVIQALRKVIRIAVQHEWINRDPFVNFKISFTETTPTYLTMEELQAIRSKYFEIPRLAQIRDVFVFSCYTGLAYVDILKLTSSDLTIGIDGEKWIITNRTKTETRSPIPLLPPALEIIERYKEDRSLAQANKLLPVVSNQKTNAFLKEIAIICGINKNLTFHVARHTFATTVTLTNDVPIETVSKMLGHKSIKTTQHYSRVVDSKISRDMMQLKARLTSTQPNLGKVVNFDE